MQAAQQEHLQKLIETSPALSPAEKAEWVDMLILMNDKQAGELEQILNAHHAPPPGPPPAAPAAPPASAAIPALAHISNLPAGLNVSPVADIPRPAPPPLSRPAADSAAASSMPWQKQLEKVTKEKELPAGNIPFQQPKQTPVPPKPAAPVPPPPHAPPRPAPADSVSGSATAPGVRPVLENLANVGALTLAAMRAMDPADLLIRLQQLAKMEGYFNVLSYLEDSALYKSYIDTGKQALTNRNLFAQDGAHLMTKKEFETFTDVLRKIQVN